jgi:putative NADH-flavin reductase
MGATSHRRRGWGVPVGARTLRIAVYGGAGMIGSRIAAEALSRGHSVTGITRTSAGQVPDGVTRRFGDAGDDDDVAMVAAQHDMVVSAIGPSRAGGRPSDFLDAVQTLVENIGPRRIIFVGGSGSLLAAPGLRLVDTPEFSPAAKPEALAQAEALTLLRESQHLADWVYISPPPSIAPGVRTGRYRTGGDTPVGDFITVEDFAVAVLDEVENPRHRRARFTVAAERRA